MVINSKIQRALTSNALIIPTAIIIGGGFWIYRMYCKERLAGRREKRVKL